MEKTVALPFYAKFALVLVGLVTFTFILYIGQGIAIPLVFATILAILLNPLVILLVKKKVNRVVAIFLAILVAFITIGALLYFISSQASLFSESYPLLKKKIGVLMQDGVKWSSKTFNTSPRKINAWIGKMESEGLNKSAVVIGQTLDTLSGVLVLIFLLPVYIFMLLFYKPLLLGFIGRLFADNSHATVMEILEETKSLVQNYLIGLLLEALIVATLNAVALLILGIPYAILLGVIGALLNMIPYIGGIIAIALPMVMALAFKPPIYLLFILAAYVIVQFIDNNFIVPKIVASKVKINALASIVVVLIGGALWGVPGMFLSLPLTAIAKVIFDRVEGLKPWGYLLGDTMPEVGESLFNWKE